MLPRIGVALMCRLAAVGAILEHQMESAVGEPLVAIFRPMLVVVLNCWVIETKETSRRSKTSTSLAKSDSARVSRSRAMREIG
jgi:hypothetical protein